MRFKPIYFCVALTVFVFELLVATTFSSIAFIRGSVSDFLVVIFLYYTLLSFCHIHPVMLSLGIFFFACVIEIGQYFHFVDILGFKRDGMLGVLLGATFSWNDIAMYFFGCIAALVFNLFIFKDQVSNA